MSRPAGRGRPWHLAASGVSALAVAWVVWRFAAHVHALPETRTSDLALVVVSGSIAYAVLNALLVLAWRWLLGAYDRRPRPATAYAVWARSQIAKYLPGNFLHLASRHVLGRNRDLSHPGLVFAGIFEIASLVGAAVTIAAFGAARTRTGPSALWIAGAGALVAAFCWPFAERVLRRFPPTSTAMAALPALSSRALWRLLVPAWVLHLGFLSGTGVLLFALLGYLWPQDAVAGGTVVAAFAVAWLAGLVVPGAPGGLGVREAMLVLQLTPGVGAATATAAALVLRAITLAGDVETALLGWLLERGPTRRAHSSRPSE